MAHSLSNEIWGMTISMSPYLLLGFLLAGLMHEFIPRRVYSQYLSRPNFRSVLLAALFGVPLPLCSCGVLPTAMGLRREGCSRGATISFLIATPQTGVDSIFATYSLMGLPFAIIRPIVAFVTAILGGTLVNVFQSEDEVIIVRKPEEQPEHKSFFAKLSDSIHYGFVEMMGDIGRWLVMGLLVAGIITALVPDQWFQLFQGNSLLSILLVLCISVPMYVCATGSIPIAVALMMKGLTPGAALVLLMAGPACNVASMLVVDRVLGRRTLLLYLSAIVGGAVLFGLGIDYLLPRYLFMSPAILQGSCCNVEHASWLGHVSAILLLVLLINALYFHNDRSKLTQEANADSTSNAPSTHSVLFHIEGMSCSHCAANIQRAITSVEGVESAIVSLTDKSAIVTGNFDANLVCEAIESIGYTVVDS